MPFPNEHSGRLISPGSLNPIRVRRTKGSGAAMVKGVKIPSSISVIWYIIRREGKEVPVAQALRFPISTWTEKEARKWLKDKKIKPILFEPAKKREKKEIKKLHGVFHSLWEMGDDSLEMVSDRGAIKKGHDIIAEEMNNMGMEHASILVLDNIEKKDEESEDRSNVLEVIEHILDEEKREFAVNEAIKKDVSETIVPIIKIDKEERMVYGIVLEPNVLDTQGDVVSEEEVRLACHRFMEFYQKVGYQHEEFNKKFRIMECGIEKAEAVVNGQTVRKGSWTMTVRVVDDDTWKEVKKGSVTGFSVGGFGKRTRRAA